MSDDFLIDAALVPNPDADEELAASEAEQLSDDEVAGARMRVIRKSIEAIDGGDGVAVALTAEFHPAAGTRFTHADIRLRLLQPGEARIIEMAPTELHSPDPISFKVTQSGKISFEKVVTAEADASRERSYSVYPCLVRGSGTASRLAVWSFEEFSAASGGIGQEQDLVLTLSGLGPFEAELIVAARLLKPGLGGALQRLRDLILGPTLEGEPAQFIKLPSPPPHRRGWFSFTR